MAAAALLQWEQQEEPSASALPLASLPAAEGLNLDLGLVGTKSARRRHGRR